MMRVGSIIVCVSLVLMNFQFPIDDLSNTDGPTFPLEVSTDKYYYALGENVSITLTNVGTETIIFPWYPYDHYIVEFDGDVVVDTRLCWPRLAVLIEIPPGSNISDGWGQGHLICDESNSPVPPSFEPVPPGKYRISVGFDAAGYGNQTMPIWDSVWIEIGSGNSLPVADAGPDQASNEGEEVLFDGTGSYVPGGGGEWAFRSKDPWPAFGAGSAVLDDEIYYIGGDPVDCFINPVNYSQKYNPGTNTWTPIADLPGDREDMGLAAANGKIYSIGGYDWFWYDTDSIFEYDPAKDKWTEKSPMPIPMAAFGIASVNDRIYVMGGYSSQLWCSPCSEVWEYDPENENWTKRSNMPTARAHFDTAVLDGKIYAIGGKTSGPTDTVEMYDPSTDSWTTISSMPTSRQGLSTETLNGKIYAFGGWASGWYLMNNTEIYNPSTSSWKSGPSLIQGRTRFGSGVVDDCIYAIGGVSFDPLFEPPPNSTEAFCLGIDFTYEWDFDDTFDSDGDGYYNNDVDAIGPTPKHVYGDDGNYTVTLKIIDDSGYWDTDTCLVTVHNLPPNADSGGPYEDFEGKPIMFKGVANDPGFLDTHSFWWDFNYDGVTFTSDAKGYQIQKTWYDDLFATIALKVVDDEGDWDIDVTNVTVKNVPPRPNAGDNQMGTEPSTFTFEGTFYDPGTLDTHILEWDFQFDGNTFDVDATGQIVTHTYPDDFNGYAALRVTDDDGGVGLNTVHVLVENVPPTAQLTVLPTEVDVLLRIAGEKWHDVKVELFEEGALIADETLVRSIGSPDDQMLSLFHIKGDVTKKYMATVLYTPEDDPVNGQPNGASPCWIILRFSDGEELWIEHTFNVQHAGTHAWEVDLTEAILLHGITFQASAHDPGADDLTIFWDFGDGQSAHSIHLNANGEYPVHVVETITHVFPSRGAYAITLTVEDDDGGLVVVQIMVNI